ncbi:MAG: mercury methylation corrinoid protein HgcA, partial [Syntrophales bacterium]
MEEVPIVFPVISHLTQAGEIQLGLPSCDQPFVVGSLETSIGAVPKVDSILTPQDKWGTVKARWGVGRMDYTVEPGLYALGNPDNESRVLITANYKMSFDRLREALPGHDAWLLVLDTRGINVWCAAGKGTFGTEELVRRIKVSGLDRVVTHRELILPQLSGPGVAAHLVKKFSGFKVKYGPIRASDLPAYLEAVLIATPMMRMKTFTLRERVALIPIELVAALKPA